VLEGSSLIVGFFGAAIIKASICSGECRFRFFIESLFANLG